MYFECVSNLKVLGVMCMKNRFETITSNNKFLLMLGEFKTNHFFVEKTKLTNKLYVENLNHLS